jgi:hypothetical protein
MDEQEIITLQKRVMQEKFGSIHSPVTYVHGRRYHFIEQSIPIADMLIRLPKEFSDLPPNIAKRKYPTEERPQCIKSSGDLCVNFAFKMLPAAAREEDLIQARNAALSALKRVQPQNTYLETGVMSFGLKKERICCWFEYCGPTLDSEVYSFNAIMRQNGRPLYFLFNCPRTDYESWRPLIFETIETIRDTPIGWKGDSEQ